MDERESIRKVVENTVNEYIRSNLGRFSTISVGISNRHVHLSKEHLETLFGVGYSMKELFKLSQTGQYAAKEVVTLIGIKGVIEGVRILGPIRGQTQVEILMSDTYKLGIRPPIRDSGNLENTPGITILGPCGVINIQSGVIVAKRHIHLSSTEAERLKLHDQNEVRVGISGERGMVFDKVLVRVDPTFNAEFHVDMDEANAAGLKKGELVQILR
ncbi:MAG: phosphate propanoyltransferase [Ruminiclostridium sp.]